MIGTEDEKVETAIGIIRENSATRVQITPLMSYGGVDCCAINTAPVPRTGRSCSWSMSRGMNGLTGCKAAQRNKDLKIALPV
jgi:hypothetical protein